MTLFSVFADGVPGISSGTAAAAAGGSTTVVDMPLNSDPVTITAELLLQKMEVAKVGWGIEVEVMDKAWVLGLGSRDCSSTCSK